MLKDASFQTLPPHLLQAPHGVKLNTLIAEASDAPYVVPLRKRGNENEIKSTRYFHLKLFEKKPPFFHHHYSSLNFVLYFNGIANSSGP